LLIFNGRDFYLQIVCFIKLKQLIRDLHTDHTTASYPAGAAPLDVPWWSWGRASRCAAMATSCRRSLWMRHRLTSIYTCRRTGGQAKLVQEQVDCSRPFVDVI
jgi:hypothetical protein